MNAQPLLIAVAVTAVVVLAYQAQHDKTWRRFTALREITIVVAGYFAYFLVRGATEGDVTTALAHADLIERWEDALGIFFEPTLQAAVVGERWLVQLFNYVYLWGHWPVIAAVAIWLYLRRPEAYRLYRTAFLVSGAIGLVLFWAFPMAPPRLTELHFVDTVTEHADIYRLLQPKALTNQYAAFPSLHFGWNLLIGIALVSEGRRVPVRVLGLLSPVAMCAAVVLTANHYILDVVAGAATALVGLLVASYLLGTGGRRPALRTTQRRVTAMGTSLFADWIRPSIREVHRRTWSAGFVDLRRPSIRVRRASADAGDGSPPVFLA